MTLSSHAKKSGFNLAQILLLSICLGFLPGCSGNGNVDLANATPLTAEAVDTPNLPAPTVHPLFNFSPGTAVPVSKLGTVDATGYSILNDYDGDGIPNNNSNDPSQNVEMQGGSNQWVADYAMVEASVAPPVLMKIQIIQQGTLTADTINTQTNSNDYTQVKNQGTEKLHQNEVNTRTAQIQNSYSNANSNSGSTTTSSESSGNLGFSFMGIGIGGGGSSSHSQTNSWAQSTSYASTVTLFPTVPYVNNLDRDAVTLNSDAASRNASQYRNNLTQKINQQFTIQPNAGSVVGALYIKNLSTNMPVHLTNILCTFMFEANDGSLIPMQSFRLRNADYSLFSVDVYGNSQFGPYVVQLNNLNTAEIQRAIQLGFNPKIYIVDYQMTHVPNSNYRNILTGYSGDNVKIVEENAKGRTAIVKVKGPQMREMYRVAAFATSIESPVSCPTVNGQTVACPGISMRKALERIRDSAVVRGDQYYATNIEYTDYIFDFSNQYPRMPAAQQKVYLRTVKTIGNVSNQIPCEQLAGQATPIPSQQANELGISNIPVCKAKPFDQLSPSEQQAFGVWVVFANGRFYTNSQYETTNGVINNYSYATSGGSCPGGCTASVAQGVDGTIWVGDNYDWVYLSLAQFLALQNQFGNNPLQTGATISFNTKWDLGDGNTNIFDPQYNSKYIGQATLGDKIEIVVNLANTNYLNPQFGVDASSGNLFVSNFNYNNQSVAKKFSYDEAIDFEINLGTGGTAADWSNISQLNSSANAYFQAGNGNGSSNCGKSVDYVNQQFTICAQLPTFVQNGNTNGTVSVYLRPVLHNAYRNTVWPKPYSQVNRVQGALANTYNFPVTSVDLVAVIGDITAINPSDTLIIAEAGYQCSYSISSKQPNANGGVHLDFSGAPSCSGTPTLHTVGTIAGVPGALTQSEVYFTITQNPVYKNTYFDDFNAFFGGVLGQRLATGNITSSDSDCIAPSGPLRFGPFCFGLSGASNNSYTYLISNWIGGADQSRSFNDALHLRNNDYLSSLKSQFYPTTAAGSFWAITPMGSTFNSSATATALNVNSAVDTSQKIANFKFANRVLYIWELRLGNTRTVKARMVNSDDGTDIMPEVQLYSDSLSSQNLSFTAIPFSATHANGQVAIAVGNYSTVQKFASDMTLIPNDFTYTSSLSTIVININTATVGMLQTISGLQGYWLTSYAVSAPDSTGQFLLDYTTSQYQYFDRTQVTQTVTVYSCGYANGVVATAPNGQIACRYDCSAQAADGMNPGGFQCFDDVWLAAYSSPQQQTNTTDVPKTGGVNNLYSVFGIPTGLTPVNSIAYGASTSVKVNLISRTPDGKNYYAWTSINNSLVNTSYVHSDVTGQLDTVPTNLTYPIDFQSIEPVGLASTIVAGVGATPANSNAALSLIVINSNTTQVNYFPVSNLQMDCGLVTTNCFSQTKFAPKSLTVTWLEDQNNGLNTRNLYTKDFTINDDGTFSNTLPNQIISAQSIANPIVIIDNERTMVTSWILNNQYYAAGRDKALPPGQNSAPISLYYPGASVSIISGAVLDARGYWSVIQSTASQSSPVVLSGNISNIFSYNYGLNNFFAAPLIERNYTVTTKILLQ